MSDALGAYLREIGRTRLLTAGDEVDLARRIEAGLYARHLLAAGKQSAELHRVALDGAEAKEQLIRANLRLVVAAAKRYVHRGLPLLDLIQEGNLGLMRAVEKFDYARGYKFSTYAMWWIRQAIERGVNDKARTVRLPVHVAEEVARLTRLERRLLVDLGREPEVEELAEAAGRTVEQIADLRAVGQETISLDLPVGANGEGRIGDLIVEDEGLRVQEFLERQVFGDQLRRMIELLPPRESFILRARYGLAGRETQTYREIAECLGLTRERIRQLEKQALKRLRERRDLLAWAS
ncbi:sigma-70 family RNA polymerase sigma factor [Nonomuraea sp. NPDC050310]|uniref:sigma-70 family RNA polymerase sigma factor n=1 Tax=unclassified Nonomuraea TaxID=2593643 RepID=UPI0033F474D1